MQLPQRVQEIIDEMYKNYKSLVFTEENQRQLTRMIAEQICYELGPEWGCKSADPNRPQSPSNIAYQSPDGLVCWRWLDGDGSISGIPFGIARPPVFASIKGQNFIPVAPTNYLNVSLEAFPLNPPIPIPSVEVGESPALTRTLDLLDLLKKVLPRLSGIEGDLVNIQEQIVNLSIKQDRRYVSKMFGITVVMSPENQEKK